MACLVKREAGESLPSGSGVTKAEWFMMVDWFSPLMVDDGLWFETFGHFLLSFF